MTLSHIRAVLIVLPTSAIGLLFSLFVRVVSGGDFPGIDVFMISFPLGILLYGNMRTMDLTEPRSRGLKAFVVAGVVIAYQITFLILTNWKYALLGMIYVLLIANAYRAARNPKGYHTTVPLLFLLPLSLGATFLIAHRTLSNDLVSRVFDAFSACLVLSAFTFSHYGWIGAAVHGAIFGSVVTLLCLVWENAPQRGLLSVIVDLDNLLLVLTGMMLGLFIAFLAISYMRITNARWLTEAFWRHKSGE